MNADRDFARSLSEFIALHTEHSSGQLHYLIQTFLQGGQGSPALSPAEKNDLKSRLKVDMEEHSSVPTFLQNYLHKYLTHDVWPPQATFLASLYLHRRSGDRFMPWKLRQQMVTQLQGELVAGTEQGFRQLVYSQGAGTVFRWHGVPCFKTVYDIAIYSMLIDELRPGTIIELGSGTGGSALLYADLCAGAGLTTEIISIDAAMPKISDPRIAFVEADCSRWLDATAKSNREFQRPCLVVEDFHGDLAGFFRNLDAILEAGDYLVIEDSSAKQNRIAELIADRPYLVDAKYTDFFGINCTSAINSIFIKSGDSHEAQSRPQRERQLLRDQDRAWRQRSTRTP
jgi:cephalosporin hydroxylase